MSGVKKRTRQRVAGTGRRRRVAVVTGSRAEYGLLRSIMRAVDEHPRLALQVVVTGMHLLRSFGRTEREIARDGWRIDARVPMQRGRDEVLDQAEGLARGVSGIARFLVESQSDVVVVLGDRIEALAGALAAVSTRKLLAHLHGGDVAPGDIDESVRHAITKLAHVHLAATPGAGRRIRRMGEAAERIHVVGAPGLDRLRELADEGRLHAVARRGRNAAARENGSMRRVSREDAALVVFHPTGREATVECRAMRNCLLAVKRRGLRRLIVLPNSDPGHRAVVGAIEAHRLASRGDEVEVFPSLDRDNFLRRLMRVRVLVGNSSCGIIEAPFAGTPSVNVGVRQAGRERGGRSVIDSGESLPAIEQAVDRALGLRPITPKSSRYGDGRVGGRVAVILASIPIETTFRRK